MRDGLRSWECLNCGFVYNEADGIPEDGIAPGTRWEDIPDDFVCPTCGFEKAQFNMVQI
jgi:rubredoxin